MDIIHTLCAVVGLTMLPLFSDLLRSFAVFRRGALGRAVSRAASASLILAVAAICCIGLAILFLHVLPFYKLERASWTALALAGLYLCCGTIAAHIAAVVAAPGRVALASPTARGAAAPKLPPHARFCSVCRHAVLDSDHHCLFTGTCIGRYNRRPFYCFLAHLFSASSFAVALSWQPFRLCVLSALLGPPSAGRPSACAGIGAGQLALVPALMIWLPVAPLVGWHALLLRSDRSTAQFVRRANTDGIRAAMLDLLGRRKPLCTNRAWQLALGRFSAADKLASADE